jgi:hypothetical protein
MKTILLRIWDRFAMWLAWRLPRRVVMWALYRAFAKATSGKYEDQEVPKLTAIETVERWGEK